MSALVVQNNSRPPSPSPPAPASHVMPRSLSANQRRPSTERQPISSTLLKFQWFENEAFNGVFFSLSFTLCLSLSLSLKFTNKKTKTRRNEKKRREEKRTHWRRGGEERRGEERREKKITCISLILVQIS